MRKAAADGVLSEDHAADLAGITVPTLIMWGDRDAIFSALEQQEIAAPLTKEGAPPGALRRL